MLRITVEERDASVRLVLEGRLVGPWVREFERICDEQCARRQDLHLNIDLCGVTGMDTDGQAFLQGLFHRGATFNCSGVLNQYLVELMSHSKQKSQGACRPCHSSEVVGTSVNWRN